MHTPTAAIARRLVLPLVFVALRLLGQQPDSLTRGLVAYYPFDGDARDAGPNGFDAVVNGARMTADRFGYANKAFLFNGTSDFLDAGNLNAFNFGTSDFTWCAWIQTSVPNRNSYVIAKWQDGQSGGYGLGLGGSSQGYAFVVAPVPYVDAGGGPSLADGKWHHLAASVQRGATLSLYVDSSLFSMVSISAKTGPVTNGVPLTIGKFGGGLYFPGAIDDVRVYNRALDSGAVHDVYAYESVPRGNHPAGAVAQIVNTFLVGATVTDVGAGYTNVPQVKVTGTGTGAIAAAQIVNGSVASITILSPGIGYGPDTKLLIDPPPQAPRRAKALAEVVNGFAANLVLTDGGSGYTTPPTVTILGGGTGATATAKIANGVVVGFTITNPGTGYFSAPSVSIDSPAVPTALSVGLSKIRISANLVIGQRYVVESTANLVDWSPIGPPFVAADASSSIEVDATKLNQQYRVRTLP